MESKAHAHNNQRSCQILRLYGCTEYCFNAGYAHWDVMIQQLLSKFPIALINKDPNDIRKYHHVWAQYFREGDDYDEHMMKEAFRVQPTLELQPGVVYLPSNLIR